MEILVEYIKFTIKNYCNMNLIEKLFINCNGLMLININEFNSQGV
jgi:hypothetical protein